MSDKSVKVVPPETNKRLSGNAAKTVLACTPSKNALPADETRIVNVPNFTAALGIVNQEARFTVRTPDGDFEVDHHFEKEADLEANSQVGSTNLEKAGALFRIPQTRAMLIQKAFLSEWSKQLKQPQSRAHYANLLADEAAKKAKIQELKEAAAFLRSIHNQNL